MFDRLAVSEMIHADPAFWTFAVGSNADVQPASAVQAAAAAKRIPDHFMALSSSLETARLLLETEFTNPATGRCIEATASYREVAQRGSQSGPILQYSARRGDPQKIQQFC